MEVLPPWVESAWVVGVVMVFTVADEVMVFERVTNYRRCA